MGALEEALNWGGGFGSDQERARAQQARDEAQALEQMQLAKERMEEAEALAKEQAATDAAAAQAAADAAAAVAAADRAVVDGRTQAFYDTIFLVAASDGSVTPQERAKLALGINCLMGEGFDESTINEHLETARAMLDEVGQKGLASSIAETITDEGERFSLLIIASVVGWFGGVNTKEGLALQALAAAFDLPIKKLHEAMALAAKAG